MTTNNDQKPAEPQAGAPKDAKLMSESERAAFFREHEKKFPGSTQGLRIERKNYFK